MLLDLGECEVTRRSNQRRLLLGVLLALDYQGHLRRQGIMGHLIEGRGITLSFVVDFLFFV